MILDAMPSLITENAGAVCCGSTMDSLPGLLQDRARTGHAKLILYPLGNTTTPEEHSYRELFSEAKRMSSILLLLPGFRLNHPILIHLSEQWDAILVLGRLTCRRPSGTLAILQQRRVSSAKALGRIVNTPTITNMSDQGRAAAFVRRRSYHAVAHNRISG